jgi:outer membrane protein
MRKPGLFAAILFLVLTFAVPPLASAIGIEAAVGVWKQESAGDLSYKGDSLSFRDDLNYDSKNKAFGRVKIQTPLFMPNVYLMATSMRFGADGSKNAQFTFGDETFNANVPFTSNFRLDHYDICLFYNLPFIKTASLGKFNVDLGLDARIINFHADVDQATTGTSESKSITIGVPMIYAGAQFNPVRFLSLEAEARGSAYIHNHFFDLIGRIKVKPIKTLFIAGGYRFEDVKIDKSDVKASARFSGPFAEAGVEF